VYLWMCASSDDLIFEDRTPKGNLSFFFFKSHLVTELTPEFQVYGERGDL